MRLLKTRKFSLFCAIFNAIWALHSFVEGSYGFAAVAVFFCGGCLSNYITGDK